MNWNAMILMKGLIFDFEDWGLGNIMIRQETLTLSYSHQADIKMRSHRLLQLYDDKSAASSPQA